MRIIAISNQKGGCGKTTTGINLAATLALLQKKVLLVDLDPQGHSSCGLGVRAEKLPFSLYNLMDPLQDEKVKFSQVVLEIKPNLSLLPSHVILSAAEEELANCEGKEKRLKRVLEQAISENYSFDYVIIDCPPNLGVLTFNALEVADDIIIPIEPSFFSLHGLAKISETVEFMKKKRVHPISVHALITIFNPNTRFAEEVYHEIKLNFKEKLFKAIIHDDVKLKEAASAGESIDLYDPSSSGFKDYYALAVEVLERDWKRALPESALGWEKVMKKHYGPRRVVGGVLFQAVAPNAKTVEVAGDFNNWIPEAMYLSRTEADLWQKVVPVFSGKHRYKFIVDGEWQLDPSQDNQIENSHGFFDSYLEIA